MGAPGVFIFSADMVGAVGAVGTTAIVLGALGALGALGDPTLPGKVGPPVVGAKCATGVAGVVMVVLEDGLGGVAEGVGVLLMVKAVPFPTAAGAEGAEGAVAGVVPLPAVAWAS